MKSVADRFSEYRIMWLIVFFDMPTETKAQRKAYADFRKRLLTDGFTMFQFSLYIRHCPSWESAEMHRKRVKAIVPQWGEIGVLTVTDKQFAQMELYRGIKRPAPPPVSVQLELF
ncbi:MAG: CRISPR-associated endonuclease Cas2 [Muribaculaceae bacterium]|nr:CRISPR-associated endonuclease Cas2 [Muribaculaceae bacterium]